MRIVTIGVYGFTLTSFLDQAHAAGITTLIDVRQRRGVRGPDYVWANSKRLQAALSAEGIGYEHHRNLAPTTELRHLQYAEDDRLRVGKRSRVLLAPEYTRRYTTEILDVADLAALTSGRGGDDVLGLFCVEGHAAACHRSLIAQRLHQDDGLPILHIAAVVPASRTTSARTAIERDTPRPPAQLRR
jgi:uncharacterized protein (DUF488 family)